MGLCPCFYFEICLATIGVCVFGAPTPVGALFIFHRAKYPTGIRTKEKTMKKKLLLIGLLIITLLLTSCELNTSEETSLLGNFMNSATAVLQSFDFSTVVGAITSLLTIPFVLLIFAIAFVAIVVMIVLFLLWELIILIIEYVIVGIVALISGIVGAIVGLF